MEKIEIEIVGVATWRLHHQKNKIAVRKIAPVGEGTKKEYPHGWGILARQWEKKEGYYYNSHVVVILPKEEIEVTIPINFLSKIQQIQRFDFIEKKLLDRLIVEAAGKIKKEG